MSPWKPCPVHLPTEGVAGLMIEAQTKSPTETVFRQLHSSPAALAPSVCVACYLFCCLSLSSSPRRLPLPPKSPTPITGRESLLQSFSFADSAPIQRGKARFFHLFSLLVFSLSDLCCFGGGLAPVARPQSVRAHARMCAHMILLGCSTEIQSVWSVHSTVPHVSKVVRMIADIGSHSRLFRPT